MATTQNVQSFTYEKAVEWLFDNKVDVNMWENLETLEELTRLINSLISNRENGQRRLGETGHLDTELMPKSQELMQHILTHDQQMKEELTRIYLAIITFMETGVNKEIQETIECKFNDYRERIAKYQSELSNNECPIVVAGETSAGKSSLLNLIIGTEVLPYSLLCATSTICRLHNDARMWFEVDGQEVVIEEDSEDPTACLRDKLLPFVSVKENREKEVKQVDIYWPIPMLPKNVTIVDTPGFGESDVMNDRLLKYLPNAVAFIYVINSSTAGGIQEDKLLHILNKQKEWDNDSQLFSFDYKCILFVCNKWDQVEQTNEEEKVWNDTILKLKGVFPDLPEGQVFKMCTTEALRYQKSGLGNTEKFGKLLQGIEKLVPQSLKTKVDRHYRWLERFIGQLQMIINARVSHAQASEEEKNKLHEAVSARLNKLNTDSERVKRELVNTAKARCDMIVQEMFQHLHSESVTKYLLNWQEEDAPEVINDFEVTRYNAERKIHSRIQDVLKRWENDNKLLETVSDELITMFTRECRLLGQQCQGIDLMIEGVSDQSVFDPDDGNQVKEKSKLFTGSERVILVIAAPLWVPLMAAASLLFLPVGLGMIIREKVKQNNRLKEYKANKVSFMKQWTEELIEKLFTEDSLKKFIFSSYFNRFEAKINELCSNFIPKQIELDRKMINDINEDRRTSHEILGQFLPIQKRLKDVLGQLYMYRLRYETEELINSRQIEKGRKLGSGSYSDVYEAVWVENGNRTKIALKELRYELRGQTIYTQLKEVDSLRALRHPNLVKFHGVCYENSRDSTFDNNEVNERRESIGGKLLLLFEFCQDNLENLVFNNKNLQCGLFNSIPSRYEAFKFYVTMTTGICDGLAYIHKQEYMHRDLKLANILVKDSHIPKICDLGFAKEEFISSGTFVGTVTHMSPELLSGRHYTRKTDIYSLAILMWELWNGRAAFSDSEYSRYQGTQLLDMVKTGMRPKPRTKFAMTPEVEEIVVSCWDKDPDQRMEAAEVGVRLRDIFKRYHGEDIYPQIA